MALDLILDSLTRSVSEGILGENKQPKPLADASGYKLSAIGLAPVATTFRHSVAKTQPELTAAQRSGTGVLRLTSRRHLIQGVAETAETGCRQLFLFWPDGPDRQISVFRSCAAKYSSAVIVGHECPPAFPPQTGIPSNMRQARRQSRKPERRRMETAVLTLLSLACALAVSGCASMGLSDTFLSETQSPFEKPSTIRSQNSTASDDESPSTSVAADYSPLQASAGSTISSSGGSNTAIGVVPVYASGHSFVQHRARLGKPIPLPDSSRKPSKIRDEHSIDGDTNLATTLQPPVVGSGTNETTAASQRPWHQPDESGSALRPEAPESAGGTQLQLDENATDDATVDDTTTENETSTAKEPTVLDKLRGLYIPRRDESISKRNRKSTPRWTNPFGLLRDPEAETVDAIIGATTPLPSPAEAAVAGTEPIDTTAGVPGSEALLEPLIAQMEKEFAQWPTLPNGNARNEVEWRRRQTDLRMLYLIAGRSAESIRVIESLPEKEQEFWQSMMLAMESYRRSDDSAARAEQLTETLEYVRTASRQLQPLSTMKIRRLNFCNRIDGFGSFSVFPTSDFNAGQPLLLYAEIENYRSELTSDSRYRSEFAAMIEFFREGETEPIATRTIRLPEIEDLCSAERTDYFQSYELTVPSLSPGKYTLRLRVRDQLSLQTATSELPFEIRPLGSQQ